MEEAEAYIDEKMAVAKKYALWEEQIRKENRRMKKLIKWLAAVSSCLAIVLLCGGRAQAADYSISTNDSWVSGNVQEGEVNYYGFTLPSAGRLTVTYQSYSKYGGCSLFDKDLVKEYDRRNISGSDTSPGTNQYSIDLEAGSYNLKLCGAYGGASKYRVKASFVPANNNEKEPNDAFETAMPLPGGKLIRGFLSQDDSLDFYKFTINAGSTVRAIMNTSLKGYYFSVWDAEFIEVRSGYKYGGTYIWEEYLAPGTYYIKILRSDYTGTYTLKCSSFQYVSSVKLKKASLVMEKGKDYSLLKSVAPASATNKKLQWTSDNTAVAKVSSKGKVTAKGVGAATITANALDGSGAQASCQIVVKPARTQVAACKRFKDRNVYLKVKGQKNVSGIQYQLSRNKDFKGKTSSYFGGTGETVARTGILSKNKTYYFRARMFIDYGGKRYYGAWSAAKSVKTKAKSADYGYFLWNDI